MDDTEEKLDELLKSLDIDKNLVYHVILSGGIEIVAELLPFNSKTKKFTAINPLKSIKDIVIEEDDYAMNYEILTIFDPNMGSPIIELDSSNIIMKYKVDEYKLERYVYTLYEYYFPIDIKVDFDKKKSKKKLSSKTNIVSFIDYKDKRIKGLF